MTEQNNQQAAQQQPATTTASVQQPVAVQPAHDFQRMSLEQFNARLAGEREAATRAALQALGVDSLDTVKTKLAKAQELERAQMSEAEKIAARLKELEPAAAKATALEAVVQRQLKAAEAAIPEAKRGLLKLAPPESDPVARLDWITNAHAEKLFAIEQPQQPQPAHTRAGSGAPPTPATGQKHPSEMTPQERQAAFASLFK